YNAPYPDIRYKAGVRRFPEMVMVGLSKNNKINVQIKLSRYLYMSKKKKCLHRIPVELSHLFFAAEEYKIRHKFECIQHNVGS
ncbi:MAG: hypothetical protein AAGI38_20995, partial [Bacteroidota bacterium]